MKTTKEFIDKANKIHNYKYNYSLSEYKGNHKNIKIICFDHGIFEQFPSNHLKGHGCPSCVKVKKSSTKEFIDKSNLIHKNTYDYSSVDYKNAKSKVEIICKEHGIFEQSPTNHLNGQGCPKCKGQNRNIDDIIKDFNKIHNFKYDYSLVKFKNCRTKVKIICKTHGIFEQTPTGHLLGRGCSKCAGCKRKTTEEFINESNKIHNFNYDYSLTEYKNAKSKVKIICKIHGIFEQNTYHHIRGIGCPFCCNSKGEIEIRDYLISKNIKFKQNKRFNKCKDKKTLPFDFYLPENKTCIEFDGIQHFESVEYWGGQSALKTQQLRDQIKTNFCLENNIKLLRIKYNENILEKLQSYFHF